MHTNHTNRVVKTPDERGIRFAAEMIEAERRLLAIGWLDCAALNDAGFISGLRGWHFAIPLHSALYTYLCCKAERHSPPRIAEAVSLTRPYAWIEDCELLTLIEIYGVDALVGPAAEKNLLRLAQTIINNHRRVRQYRACLARARAILDRDPAELAVAPRGVRISKPSRRVAYV